MMMRLIANALFVFSVSAHADKAAMVFMQENGDEKQILSMDLATKAVTPLTRGSSWHLYPAISSDGQYLAYVQGSDEAHLGLMLKELKTGRVFELVPPDGMTLHPDFSGDGRFLAASTPISGAKTNSILLFDLALLHSAPATKLDRGGQEVWSVDLSPKCVTCSAGLEPGGNYFPTLSSDGSWMISQLSRADGKKSLYKITFDPMNIEAINAPADVSMAPALSFDDLRVTYTSHVAGNWDVYVTDLLTKTTVRATKNVARDFAPAFDRHGNLVFASERLNNVFQLFSIKKELIASAVDQAELFLELPGSLYAPDFSGETLLKQELLPAIPGNPRSSFGAITYDDKVFVAGGHQGHEHTYPPESFVDRVDYFDLKTGQWQQTEALPFAVQGFGLAGWGRYIYAFGGFAYSAVHKPGWKSLDVIQRYNLDTGHWETVGRLPRARSSNVTAQIGKKVYLIGGWDSTPKFPNDADGVFHREVDVVDLETLAVTTESYLLPAARRAFTGVVQGDKVYLLGGISPGASHFDLLATVTEFDAAQGSFRDLTPLPFETFAPAAGLLGGKLHVFGGMFKTGAMDYVYVNHVFRADAQKANWEHLGRHLRETKGFSMVVDLPNGAIGLLGGHTYKGDYDTPVATFEKLSY